MLILFAAVGWQVVPATVYGAVINYDRISFFNRPVAYPTNYGTLSVNFLLDASYQSENNEASRFDNLQNVSRVLYEHQLANDWDIGASYEFDYNAERGDRVIDEFQFFALDQWGFASIGNMASQVFDRSKRQPARGLLGITDDNFSLTLDEYGGFYQWASADTKWMIAVDSAGSTESAVVYNKPIGTVDYMVSARISVVDLETENAQGVDRGRGVALVAQARRGRWLVDAQYLQENLELVDGDTAFDLAAVSAGVHYDFNRLKISLTAISRQNTLQNRQRSVAMGLRYNLARGLSVNAGARVSDSELFPENFRSLAVSLRYEL